MVGEKLLKFEHTRWHMSSQKNTPLYKSGIKQHDTLQQQISLRPLVWLRATYCSGKILLWRQDFQKHFEISKKWFVPATSHIATTCYCILWLSVPTFYTYLQKNGVFWSSLLMWLTHVALILQIFLEALLGTYLSTWSINSLLCGSISMDRGH